MFGSEVTWTDSSLISFYWIYKNNNVICSNILKSSYSMSWTNQDLIPWHQWIFHSWVNKSLKSLKSKFTLSIYIHEKCSPYLEKRGNWWWCNLVCVCIKYQIKALGLAWFWCRIKPKSSKYCKTYFSTNSIIQIRSAHHSGSLEPAIAFIASCSVILITCSWYLFFIYISSAFCLLKEQHIPLSVGCILNIDAQLSGFPLHKHFFNIPVDIIILLQW